MTPLADKIARARRSIATALARFRKRAELIFLSKRENARRASGRSEVLKRAEREAERLDRLRHPSRYQGR